MEHNLRIISSQPTGAVQNLVNCNSDLSDIFQWKGFLQFLLTPVDTSWYHCNDVVVR